MLIKEVAFNKNSSQEYPYFLPFFGEKIEFNTPVTILVGENGSGKSTLLKLIKEQLGLYQIGKPIKKVVSNDVKVTCNVKKPKGFFFSSEDFTFYIKQLEDEKKESNQALEEIKENYKNRSLLANDLAAMPHQRTLNEINNLYERDLSQASHGEAYLPFFKSRLRSEHLILLDEPETPLSFHHQLSLMYLLKEAIDDKCQIIIATHSPVIMAYPQATIYKFTENSVDKVDYQSLEEVTLMRTFLINPNAFLSHLFE